MDTNVAYQEGLQQIFKFDDADLAANRTGSVTPKQEERLRRRSHWSRIGGAIVGVVCFAFAGALIVAAVAIVRHATSGAERIVWPAALGVFALIGVLLGLMGFHRLFGKASFAVLRAEGPVNIVNRISSYYDSSSGVTRESSVHELHVGGKTFEVPGMLADHVMQGDRYAVYYVEPPGSPVTIPHTSILSMEAISV